MPSPLTLAALLAAAFALAPGAARAADLGEKVMAVGGKVALAELLVPDLRLSLGGGAPRVALAWPLMVGVGDLWFGSDPERGFRACSGCSELGSALYLSAFVEPQWEPRGGAARGRFGVRTLLHNDDLQPWALAFDAGGTGGEGGPGGFVGAFAGAEVFGIALLAGGRRVWTWEGNSWELSVDLAVPLQWLDAG